MAARIDAWLAAAIADANARGLPGLEPLLRPLARSTTALREADREARDAVRTDRSVEPPIAGPER